MVFIEANLAEAVSATLYYSLFRGLGNVFAVGAASMGALALAFALGRSKRSSGEGSTAEPLKELGD